MVAGGYGHILGTNSTVSTPTLVNQEKFTFADEQKQFIANRPPMSPPTEIDLPETERFLVELKKDSNGLGITIAGYVCEKEELSGIFVKSVSPGSAADLSGRIHVNDRIIEVDQQSLQGYSNHQAVEVLKKSGTIVSLCLERYLRGPKYEQLQQAIAANELKPQTPSGSGTIFAGPGRPHSVMSSTQSVGSAEHIRRSSLTSPFSNTANDAVNIESQSFKPEKPTVPPKDSSIAAVSARKLVNARDSIENKMEKEFYIDKDGANEMDAEHKSVLDKPKYWIEPNLKKDAEKAIVNKWQSILGTHLKIIVAQIRKYAASSGLGISLEGTVDVEGGREVRPHHYIRSILPEGPVGQNALLRSGDELLGKLMMKREVLKVLKKKNLINFLIFPTEVNGQRLLGMNHLEVVSILKELPQDVRIVCARSEVEMVPFTEENVRKNLEMEFGGSQNLNDLAPSSDRLVKAKSDGSLATTGGGPDEVFNKLKSRYCIFFF